MDDEVDKEQPLDKGNIIHLETLQYEQVRRWVFISYDGIEEWEKMISPSQSTPNPSEPLLIPTGGLYEHSTTSGGDSSKPKIPLKLSLLGHVVGKNLTKFMSGLGNLVREHIPPYYPDCLVVPDRFKDTIWQIICEEYKLPEAAKTKLMKSANNFWRNGKKTLRKKYDEWDTYEARKNNCPKKARPENWVRFVDLTSTEEVKASWERNKINRSNMMEVDPTTTRSDSFLVGHTCSDGTIPTALVADKVVRFIFVH
ncbi:hypothetical protein GIB67_036560 [Kingdonia uniflora]|uniref:Uncharacterized protein n=1 Tax=Kingdonia uniflora TaxID=39325 RepID=A0A7J7NZU8_9MAGN|nr:hypothetical protein GIB67_036560 [Kingdonia uniflora]